MAKYIITGCFSAEGIRGMISNPSDREEAVKPLIVAVGGTLLSYLVTFGKTDFQMVVETEDVEGLMAALMVAGASGGISGLKTTQAFTTVEFAAAQHRAQTMVAGYQAPNS
tara:strand:+ start:7123 stop:7455 length:333 start_codon:yes stop_codon:yes gene_type:complete